MFIWIQQIKIKKLKRNRIDPNKIINISKKLESGSYLFTHVVTHSIIFGSSRRIYPVHVHVYTLSNADCCTFLAPQSLVKQVKEKQANRRQIYIGTFPPIIYKMYFVNSVKFYCLEDKKEKKLHGGHGSRRCLIWVVLECLHHDGKVDAFQCLCLYVSKMIWRVQVLYIITCSTTHKYVLLCQLPYSP